MKVKAIISVVTFTLKKYSPEILIGVGIAGVVGSTVLACKATLQCEEILDKHQENLEKVETCLVLCAEEGEPDTPDYTEEQAQKDRIIIHTNTVISFVKLYAPAATLLAASVGCILGGYRIMSKRNVALMAAYKVIEEAFTNYRKRVRDELGDGKDAHFLYGTDTIESDEIVVDEDGKERVEKRKKEELIPGAKLSGFARIFEEDKPDQMGGWTGSTQWCKIHDYNLEFLTRKEAHFNDMLAAKGFVTINDVFDELGFDRTEAGMICGWRYKSERGDGYISFHPRGIDGKWIMGTDGDSIILDFNIDGVIFDQEYARNELK